MSVFQKILRAGEGRTLKRHAGARARDQRPRARDRRALRRRAAREDGGVPRARFDQGEELDDLLPEAFACVREAAKRTVGMRHFDVQLIGGMVLHEGRIAEMKTGEGKTLVATLPLYLNALAGVNVQLVTVNDYLAKRDAEWMRPVYEALGRERRHHPVGDARRLGADQPPRRLRLRHHLRHELRVRLRLPARQHGGRAHPDRPARPLVRDRRRGRLDPDRRGAHAAHHLGPAGAGRRDLLLLRQRRARPRAAAPTTRSTRSSTRPRRPRTA